MPYVLRVTDAKPVAVEALEILPLLDALQRLPALPIKSIRAWAETLQAVLDLPESGGTVGPLPDGRVIEVKQISPMMLASRCGASGASVMSCLRSDDWTPLIEAFNARHS